LGRWLKATVAAILAMAVCLAAVHFSARRFADSRRQELENEARVTALEISARLGGALDQHQIALLQMANFFENSQEVTRGEFNRFASSTVGMRPPCLRLLFVDRSFRVARVFPPKEGPLLLGHDVREDDPFYDAIIRAIQSRRPFLSRALDLSEGVRGFTLTVPVSRGGRYFGALSSAFSLDEFFAAILLPAALQRYEVKVMGSGRLLFASPEFDDRAGPAPIIVEGFVLAGTRWEVHVRPRAEAAHAFLESGQTTLWVFGWLLTLAMGAVAGLLTFLVATQLQSQGVALQETRARLDGAMQQLMQAEKLNALGELVAGVAHEINNPLSAIMGWTHLLLARNPSPEFRRRLETMYSEEQRIGKIVRNLLTFARKHPPEKKYLGLNGIIEKTLELKAYHFKVNQIRVEKDLQPDLPMTMLDFHHLQQVLLNLLTNAEQAMVAAGQGGRIRITTRRSGETIEARVTDDGPGIPPEIQSRIFEPFFTTKKEGKGTGLGLSLCYGIVREHDGTLEVESRPGEGATFIVRLPIVQDPSSLVAGPGHDSLGETPRLRLLIVDDEESILEFLVELLTMKGHRIDTASDVPEALRKVAAGGHDVIISDMKMPQGSGKAIYEAARKRDPGLARRIIFTTGDAANPDTLGFIREVGNEFLLKPFKIEDLEQAIARAARN
jgi:signal transduction histidine kinase/CheY-like chemotaxis protein